MEYTTLATNETHAATELDIGDTSVENHNKKVLSELQKYHGMKPPTEVLFHLAPERFDDETFEQYKERRAENNSYITKYLKQGNSYRRPY
jgi:hypothetical protein